MTRIRATLFIPIAIVALHAACAGERAPELAQWRLVEEWRVGGAADGPHSFDFNMGLGLLPGHRFVHFDYKSNVLHYLDSRGQPLRSVGRKGQGPGEFMVVNGLVVAPGGKVIVSDLANGFSIFSDSGTFESVIKPTAGRIGTGKRWDAFVLFDGRLVENVEQVPGQQGGESLRRIWSPDLMHAGEYPLSCAVQSSGPSTRFALRDSSGAVLAKVPFMHAEPETPVAFDFSGAIWEQRDPSRAEIVRHALRDCDVTLTVALSGTRAPFDSATRANMNEMAAAEVKRWRALEPELDNLPRQRPWYQSINLDESRNLWVERIGGDGNFRIEIFSADGKPVSEIRGTLLPVFPIITVTHVYGLMQDKDGVRHLVAFRIEKPEGNVKLGKNEK